MVKSARKMVVAVLLFPLCGSAQVWDWEVDWEVVDQVGGQLFETIVPESLQEELEWPGREDWLTFGRTLDAALHGDDLTQLAWLKPQAVAAITTLRSFSFMEPFADWLQQRLDYIDVAEEAVTPPPTRIDPSPPPRPAAVSQPATWERKLAGRPAPARAAALVPGLKSIFMAEGVPPELVWLAEVESSFNPEAKSPVGALGLFQFMPASAERFGMRLTPRDERLDPDKSARAAAQYLRFLHGRFGSWSLALAAYNAGEGRVGRTLRAQQASTFEEIAAALPNETRMYVPKVAATVELREGVRLNDLPPPRARSGIDVFGPVLGLSGQLAGRTDI
jgi:membrane-bound lytic murein transglycosylase D